MPNFSDALCKLNKSVLKTFCSVWHHYPRTESDDVDYPSVLDNSRIQQDFKGSFFEPETEHLTQDARNSHIMAQGNMAYIDTLECDDIEFRQNDCVKSCSTNKIYEISNIKRYDGGISRLFLKLGGSIV